MGSATLRAFGTLLIDKRGHVFLFSAFVQNGSAFLQITTPSVRNVLTTHKPSARTGSSAKIVALNTSNALFAVLFVAFLELANATV